MKKRWSMLTAIVLILVMAVGCGSSDDASYEPAREETKTEAVEDKKADTRNDSGSTGSSMEMADLEESEPMDDQDLASKVDSRKYIRTFRYYLETLEYDKTVSDLEQMVDLHFGFFESSESEGGGIHDSYYRRSASYTIRIPKEKVDAFTKGLAGIGNVVNKSSFTEDVTGQYADTEARIKTLEVQEERLLAILEQADNLEYIIELERELSDVRYQIESYSSSFRYLQDQINYSTVYVDLREVKEETVFEEEPETFFEKMGEGFMDSVENVIDFFANLILWLTTNSPVFLLLAVIGFIGYKIFRRFVPKRVKTKNLDKAPGDKKEE